MIQEKGHAMHHCKTGQQRQNSEIVSWLVTFLSFSNRSHESCELKAKTVQ